MAIDTGTLRSRRALLAGTLGGAVAFVGGALGRPLTGQAWCGRASRITVPQDQTPQAIGTSRHSAERCRYLPTGRFRWSLSTGSAWNSPISISTLSQ